MKILISMVFVSLYSLVYGQNTKTSYNTKINKVNKAEINNKKGGIINITQADTVIIGKIIIQGEVKTKLFLKSLGQHKDSLGIYTTYIQFANPEETKTKDINISIKCNSPILSANWSYTEGVSIGYGISETIDKEKGELYYQSAELSAKSGLIVTIRSMKKIIPLITGIDGKF